MHMRILDFHVHYNGNIGEAERFADTWRAGGIEKAVVFGVNRDDGSHTSVEEVAALADRVPEFYLPFAYLNPGYEDCVDGVQEAASRGFKGAKFIYPAKPYDDDEYFPIYEAAAKANMVCLFHTGIVIGNVGKGGLHGVGFQGKRRISSNFMRPMHLDRIARAFPDMPIVGAHLGAPSWYEEAASMLQWQTNIYFDLSIGQFHYRRRDTPAGQDGRVIKSRLRELYDSGELLLDRILFGSDAVAGNPEASPRWALDTLQFELEGLGATEEEKEAVRWGTAARLLGVG
jgi:uncharacterized protein